MPSRYIYHQTSDGCLSRKNRDFGTSEFPVPQTMLFTNKFVDSSFNLGIDEWDEWMKWEGPTAEDIPSLNGEDSSNNRKQKDARWPLRINTKMQLDTFDQMAIDDAPYELDESTAMPELDLEIASPGTPLMPDQRRIYRGYSSLTIAEVRELQEIAMPYRRESVVSTTEEERDSSSSPSSSEPTTRPRGKKRKSSTKGLELDAGDLCQSRKRGHNAIEKRYRTNLNEKIVLLRQSMPSLRVLPEGEILNADDCDKSGEASEKYGKAVILTRAVEYISHLEDCTERLGRETVALKARVAAFEKLAMAGSIQMISVASSKGSRVETLESIKADFQQSSQLKAEKIKPEPTKTKKKSSKKSSNKN